MPRLPPLRHVDSPEAQQRLTSLHSFSRYFVVCMLVAAVLLVPGTSGAWGWEETMREGLGDDTISDRHATAQPGWAQSRGAPLRWAPPLGAPLRIAQPYRPPPTPYAAGHRGIDLPAVSGNTVSAPAHGVVSFVGKVVDREVISVRVDARTVVSLEPVNAEGVAEGDAVSRSEPLGEVSTGGHCGAECLHLGVRVDGEYVNPMRFFAGRPILLPW